MKKLILLALLLSACAGPKGDKGSIGDTGSVGATGAAGTSVSILPFCPSIQGVIGYQNRESYLIIGSSVYAVYADGTHTFLTLLNPGSYVTTDGRNCHFTVASDGSVL